MAKADGNVQDMSVLDKNVSALAATEEAQDMSTLARVVVPPPSFTNPGDPGAAAGSINFDINSHPGNISEDYGINQETGEHSVESPMDQHGREVAELVTGDGTQDARTSDVAYPENRDDWQKKHWQARAAELGLSKSGNTDAVKERVEDQEKLEDEYKGYKAGDWTDDIDDAETADDLAELRAAYDRSGAEFSTVAEAFDARAAELNDDSQ